MLLRTGEADPANPAEQFEAELVGMMKEELRDRPLAILVDDIQWCDHSFPTFLRAVGRLQKDTTMSPLIVVLASAAEEPRAGIDVGHLLRQLDCQSFDLAAFDAEQIGGYLQAVSERWEGDVEELVRHLETETGGVPGHMEDALRDLRECAAIEVRSGTWRISSRQLSESSGHQTQASARVDRRLARLPLKASSVLQAIAVFHPRPVVTEDLAEVCELEGRDVTESIELLVKLGYLRHIDRHCSFRTSSDRRAVYEGIQPESTTPLLHGRIAKLLERKYRGNLEPRYPEIALHHALSSDHDAGRIHSARAARLLAGRHQPSAAIPHYDNAIRLYEQLLATAAREEDRRALAALYLDEVEAFVAVLGAEDALLKAEPLLEKSRLIAEELGDVLLRARYVAVASQAQAFRWKHVEGEDRSATRTWRTRIEAELRELSGIENRESQAARAVLLDQLGWICGRQEDHKESARALRETIGLLEALGRGKRNRVLTRLASAMSKDSDPTARAGAIEVAEEALSLARSDEDDYGIADAHRALAHAYIVNARADLAENELRRAAALCDSPSVGATKEAEILQPYGELLSELLRAEEAIPHIQRVLDANPDSQGSVAARAHFVMGKCLYRLCRYPQAREHFEHTLNYARRSAGNGRVPLEAQVNAYLGRIQIELGEYEGGSRTLLQAVERAGVDGGGDSPQHYFVADTLGYVGFGRVRSTLVAHASGRDCSEAIDDISGLARRSREAYAYPYLVGEALEACALSFSGKGAGRQLARTVASRVGDQCALQEIPLVQFLLSVAFMLDHEPTEVEEALSGLRRALSGKQQLDLEIALEGLSMKALSLQGRHKPARRHKKRLAQLTLGVLPHLARKEDADAFMDEPFRRWLLAEAESLPRDGGEE